MLIIFDKIKVVIKADCIDRFNTSRLYHLEPIGIGTADVESLTSYIKRLAHSHNVSTGMLINKEILPESSKLYLNMTHFIGGDLNLNGYSGITKELVDILENETSNKDLKYLTLIPWEHYINNHKLYKYCHSWCPVCYEEMNQNGQEIFDKLIWNINGIDVCGRHKVKLEQTCPYCGEKSKLIGYRSRVGYCDKCGAWLGMSGVATETDDSWQNKIYNNVGEFLSEIVKNTDAKSRFRYNMQKVSSLFNSQRSFCLFLNLHQTLCEKWISGNKLPLFNAVIISLQLGVSLNEILTAEIDISNVTIGNTNNNADQQHINQIKRMLTKKQNKDYAKIKKSLNLLMLSYDGTSLSRFCEKNNINLATLKKHFPGETERLRQLYKIHKENISHQRNSSLREVIFLLHENNTYPSVHAICEATNKSSLSIKDKRLRIDTLKELGCAIIYE